MRVPMGSLASIFQLYKLPTPGGVWFLCHIAGKCTKSRASNSIIRNPRLWLLEKVLKLHSMASNSARFGELEWHAIMDELDMMECAIAQVILMPQAKTEIEK